MGFGVDRGLCQPRLTVGERDLYVFLVQAGVRDLLPKACLKNWAGEGKHSRGTKDSLGHSERSISAGSQTAGGTG